MQNEARIALSKNLLFAYCTLPLEEFRLMKIAFLHLLY